MTLSQRTQRFAVGVAWGAYGDLPMDEVAREARRDGFAHLDVPSSVVSELVLPIADRFSKYPKPGCSSGPAASWTFGETVDRYRAVPTARLEPWYGSPVSSTEAALEVVAAVPGLRLLLDVGHVAAWGGDPIDLVEHADHVQLRQANLGEPQALTGVVNFREVLESLQQDNYRGALTVEYVDMPSHGFALETDPRLAAIETALELTNLLEDLGWSSRL